MVYAAGVDYILFLISRYQEELEGGAPIGEALAGALGKIGGTLAAKSRLFAVVCFKVG